MPTPSPKIRLRTARSIVLALTLAFATSGCGALLPVGGAGTSAIAFATGELTVTEAIAIGDLQAATRTAVETLRYVDADAVQDGNRIRWRATTAGGDPVDIRLISLGPLETEVHIRVGVFGNEARSRLVLEQIRRSL